MARPYRLVVLVLADCGACWGELAALKATRVDLVRRGLEVAESGSSLLIRRCER